MPLIAWRIWDSDIAARCDPVSAGIAISGGAAVLVSYLPPIAAVLVAVFAFAAVLGGVIS